MIQRPRSSDRGLISFSPTFFFSFCIKSSITFPLLQKERASAGHSTPLACLPFFLSSFMCLTPDPNDASSSSTASAMDGSDVLILELAACDDLPSLTRAAEEANLSLDAPSLWYGRWWACGELKPVRYELRTPLMVAALYGSFSVVQHLLSVDPPAVNRPCGSDSATALHCAAAGGAASAVHVVKLLLAAGADVEAQDADGRKPVDVVPKLRSRSALETLLRGGSLADGEEEDEIAVAAVEKKERKEYPVDATLPDIKSGIYGTDEFRMYSFKVKPCSRAYSHDWTECPFVHPGENARRRDPRKFHYSCVPCPDFRKGACRAGDACEYAHGVFESWLHPAQYRTRLCKDETTCNRRVCFFAHKQEELRPLYPPSSPGSLVSSPRAPSSNLPPLDLGSAAALLLNQQQPISPSTSSALAAAVWLNQAATPASQLPGSRLKTGALARGLDLDLEMMGFDAYKQQLMEEIGNITPISSSSARNCGVGVDYTDLYGGSMENASVLSPVKNLSLKPLQFQSPTQLLYSGTNLPSSPRSSPSLASALMNARASAFAKRSQSFIDRGASPTRLSNLAIPQTTAALSDWCSPNGKLDWAIQGEELSKLRKSASFALHSNIPASAAAAAAVVVAEEPDVSWVQSLVKEGPSSEGARYNLNSRAAEFRSSGEKFSTAWSDQLCLEQEQMVA